MSVVDVDVADVADVTRAGAEPSAVGQVPTERLEAEICTLGGRLAALECRWLLLVGEFDRRQAFDAWECRSTAHWLTWKCAMGSRTAHEKVRVARRLQELPLVTEAFARGELSYSKVRALTRIAVPTTEADLVSIARHATGAQMERLAAGRRKVDRLDAEHEESGDPGQAVHWSHDETGAVIIHARLSPEAGAIVVKALEAAIRQERAARPAPTATARRGERVENGSRECSAEHAPGPARPTAGAAGPDPDKAAIAGDALVSIADAYLAEPDRLRTGNDRYATLVLTDEQTLDREAPDGSCTLDDGTHVDPDTARRLACDSARQPIVRRTDGSLLDAGRQTRTINRATRRALKIRDGGCVFPGCGRTHWVDGHHIVHWADNGPTNLANLVLLCRHHHRAVHEGGYTVTGNPQHGPVSFHRPDGSPVDPHCGPVVATPDQATDHLRFLGVEIQPDTVTGSYAGDPLRPGYAVGCLVDSERGPGHRDNQIAGGFSSFDESRSGRRSGHRDSRQRPH